MKITNEFIDHFVAAKLFCLNGATDTVARGFIGMDSDDILKMDIPQSQNINPDELKQNLKIAVFRWLLKTEGIVMKRYTFYSNGERKVFDTADAMLQQREIDILENAKIAFPMNVEDVVSNGDARAKAITLAEAEASR